MPYFPDETRPERLPRFQRPARVRRLRNRRLRAAAVAVLAVALVGVVAVRANAWTLAISGTARCNPQTGNYDLRWTLDNSGEPEPATVTGDLQATVPAHKTATVTETLAGSTTGKVSRTVRINWPSDQRGLRRTGTVFLDGDCAKPAPTTTTVPTPTTREDVQTGTATDRSRHPEPTPDDSPELGRPPAVEQPTPGQLPFTDSNRNEVLLGASLAFFAAGLVLLLTTRRRERQLGLAARAVDRALRKPYRGPRERL
jgi:hypothetical protein